MMRICTLLQCSKAMVEKAVDAVGLSIAAIESFVKKHRNNVADLQPKPIAPNEYLG